MQTQTRSSKVVPFVSLLLFAALFAAPNSHGACRANAAVSGSKCEDLKVTVTLKGCHSEKLSSSSAEVLSCADNQRNDFSVVKFSCYMS
jgi:hypothetical protein